MVKDLWGDQSIPVKWLIALVTLFACLTTATEWRYMSRAEASEADRKQMSLIVANGNKVDTFISQYDTDKLIDKISNIYTEQKNLALFVSANGENALTESIETDLANKLKVLEAKQRCINAGNTEC